MSNESNISWTERTWNITSGCTKVSKGCQNCYASRIVSTRLAHLPQNEGVAKDGNWTGLVKCHEDKLSEPLRRKKPTTYFVCSQSDLFHDGVPFEFIDKAFAVMALCPHHTFILLTKRPERMEMYLNYMGKSRHIKIKMLDQAWLHHGPVLVSRREQWIEANKEAILSRFSWPLPNVWLGTSVEDQKSADERIPELLKCPAAHRFLSCEPLLGMVDLTKVATDCAGRSINSLDGSISGTEMAYNHHIDLVIVGGESGPGARPMHPDWARSLRDQCKEAGVPFYFKQWGEHVPLGRTDGYHELPFGDYNTQTGFGFKKVGKAKAGRLLDGVLHDNLPWRKEQGS